MTASCVRLWCGYRMGRSPVGLCRASAPSQECGKGIPRVVFHCDITGPYTMSEEVWLGMYVANATRLGELNTQVEGAELEEN